MTLHQAHIAAFDNAKRRDAARHSIGQTASLLHVMYSEPRTLAVDEYIARYSSTDSQED